MRHCELLSIEDSEVAVKRKEKQKSVSDPGSTYKSASAHNWLASTGRLGPTGTPDYPILSATRAIQVEPSSTPDVHFPIVLSISGSVVSLEGLRPVKYLSCNSRAMNCAFRFCPMGPIVEAICNLLNPDERSGVKHSASDATNGYTQYPAETSESNDPSWRQTRLAYVAATEFAAALLIVVAVIVVIEAFHDQIVNGLKPITRWLRGFQLFGNEVVAMLCGLVWGLGQGFGIVAAGTLLGEIVTYFFFKYCCGAHDKRLELTNI
ncbi:hypothetical protein B0H13DRAFT_1875667 [Mycena leptocephala]|nr:hypothetical protein B0H13DRAFT_1875667 [Mycena leptocephala]